MTTLLIDLVDKIFDFNEQVIGLPAEGLGEEMPLQPLPTEVKIWLMKALTEEVNEYDAAWCRQDLIKQTDSLIDLVYFAIGGLKRMGLTRDQAKRVFTVIHNKNMSKKRGGVAARGNFADDAVKPEGWIPPEEEIGRILLAKV